MGIVRVVFFKRFREANIDGLLVNTVHDSIVCDVHPKEVTRVTAMFHQVFKDTPALFEKVFGVEFNLPMLCEVLVGPNMMELSEVR